MVEVGPFSMFAIQKFPGAALITLFGNSERLMESIPFSTILWSILRIVCIGPVPVP